MSFSDLVDSPEELGLDAKTYYETRVIHDAQSVSFMCEMLPFIWKNLYDVNGTARILDVGPRTCAGSAFLQFLHNKYAFSRIKCNVTAIDIDPKFAKYAKKHFPEISFHIGDIFKKFLGQSFDMVICSHTIEHVENPQIFLNRLKQLSTGKVVIAGPFKEEVLIPGHINKFDEAFFADNGAVNLYVYKSVAWTRSPAFIAVFKGEAAP